jgi:hypothetical protein
VNFCPASAAAYIKPPLAIVNTAMPSLYMPSVLASLFPALAPEVTPLVPTLALAPAVTAIALAPAENSKLPDSN